MSKDIAKGIEKLGELAGINNNHPITLLAQNKKAEATEVIAEQLQGKTVFCTIRDDEKPEIWIYEEGIYKPNGKTYIYEYCREVLGEAYTTHIANRVADKISADTYIEQDEFFNQQNEYRNLQPVKNGILNIETKELTEFTPKIRFFNKIPITYNPEAKCPNIKKFLHEVTKRRNDVQVFKEWAGFCLLREYKYEKSLFCLGDGRNGKGKTLKLLEKLVGNDNKVNISLADIENDKFAIAELQNKLLNVCGDIAAKPIQDSSTFKGLTGRDTQQAPRKFKTRVSFVNYAKMVFSANELPPTRDLTDAFFARILAIEFPNTYLPQNEIDALPEEERTENIRLQNPNIIAEILNEKELSGFLNWALEGYEELQDKKGFSQSLTIEKIKEMWLRKSDSFRAFCLDHVRSEYENTITKEGLRKEYEKYCKNHKLKKQGNKHIKQVLEEDFGVGETRPSGKSPCWEGIRLNNPIKANKGVLTYREKGDYKSESKPLDGLDCLDSFIKEDKKSSSYQVIVTATKAIKEEKKTDLVDVEELKSFCERNEVSGFDDLLSEAIRQGELFAPKPGFVGLL